MKDIIFLGIFFFASAVALLQRSSTQPYNFKKDLAADIVGSHNESLSIALEQVYHHLNQK